MLGNMQYNRMGHDGFTDAGRGRPAPSTQTCPVCLCRVVAEGGVLPDGTVIETAQWRTEVCKQIKDDTVNGGWQGGCLAHAYPPFDT
ncbi:MAG: hypothetical protein MUF30_00025 [Burkholderiales bacterium]|jgi:hypothetical protein|nr:hypothetical protein [Burkholderiales bacterium]